MGNFRFHITLESQISDEHQLSQLQVAFQLCVYVCVCVCMCVCLVNLVTLTIRHPQAIL